MGTAGDPVGRRCRCDQRQRVLVQPRIWSMCRREDVSSAGRRRWPRGDGVVLTRGLRAARGPESPPRWGERWGHGWEQQRSGLDHWNRRAAPAPAPLPVYQRRYSGSRYPAPEQQHALQTQNYRYQPHDAAVRQHVQQAAPPTPAPRGPAVGAAVRPAPPHERAEQRPAPPHSEVPAAPARGGPAVTRPTPPPREHQEAPRAARPPERVAPPPPHQSPVVRPEPAAARPAQRGPAPGAPAPQERPERGQGQGQERERGEGRGQDRKN